MSRDCGQAGAIMQNRRFVTILRSRRITKGTIGGLLAADLATGRDNPLIADIESLGRPSALPPRPFLDLGVQLHFWAELVRWRSER